MANVKISELPNATSLSNGDSFPVVQGGVTKQAARSVLFASPTFTGTTTAAILTATGDVTFDGGAFVFNESGADKDARFEGDTDANLLFLDASTDRVGIGTATPVAKLAIDAGANALAINFNSTDASGVYARFQNSGISIGDLGAGASVLSSGAAGDFAITSRSGNLVFGTGTDERMRLDSSGNLGIGTSSPSTKLHVNTGAAGYGITVAASTQTSRTYQFGVDSNSSLAIYDSTAAAQRLILDQSGNVGIGTSSPAAKLDVNGPASVTSFTGSTRLGFTVKGSTAATDYSGIDFSGNSQTVPTARIGVLSDAGGSKLVFGTSNNYSTGITNTAVAIDASGNLYCQGVYANTTGSAANVFVASNGLLQRSTSSLKYKTDVQNALHGLAEVMQLRPVTYKGKTDGDKIFGGLIAEEVDAVGLTEFVQYAEDGSPDALAYGNMVSLLVKAIQEQQALITALTARVAALEAN